MRSLATGGFWRCLERLPSHVRRQAGDAFRLFEQNPFHPSLHFKTAGDQQDAWSVRVGIGYRAMCIREAESVTWFWIGSHADYDKKV